MKPRSLSAAHKKLLTGILNTTQPLVLTIRLEQKSSHSRAVLFSKLFVILKVWLKHGRGGKEEREMLVMTCFDKVVPKVRNLPN